MRSAWTDGHKRLDRKSLLMVIGPVAIERDALLVSMLAGPSAFHGWMS